MIHAAKIALSSAILLASCASTPDQTATDFTSSRISVITRGSGPDIVLIPGLTGHRDDWGPAIETLDDRYRLHFVQVNGFAGVPAGANADGPVAAPVAEEIARYIREVRLNRPAVVGHSMGGTIGMMVAARHPALVGRLMVVDMMPYMGTIFAPPNSGPEQVRQAADQFRGMIMSQPLDAPSHPLGQMFSTMTRVDSMKPVLARRFAASDRRTVANAFHELIATDLRPELGQITAPMTVLYVRPANVPMSAEQFDAAMKDLYGNARGVRLVRIDESNHFVQWDQAGRFVAEVQNLMER
jgi:pimeloyl-ACP methyl ester carboxylesterase